MGESVNTRYNGSYSTLDEKFKLKRSTIIKSTASDNLYAALLMTKEDNKKTKEATRIGDILYFSNKEQLSELDKQKIWFTLDNLRTRWVTKDIFKELTNEDFAKIKERQTSSGRAEALIQLIIDKSWNSENKNEILERTNAMIAWSNAELGNNLAEIMALKTISLNKIRHYWWRIRKKIKENTDSNWNINWSNCYMDVIKYANYSTMNIAKRTWTRYIAPVKFSWRNIPKQTQKTLDRLREMSSNSNNETEMFAINYIIDNLQKAFNYYKDSMWPSNTDFDSAKSENRNNIHSVAFNKKESEYRAAA